MSSQPGSLYRIGTRRYVDSQAIYNLAGAHDVVQLPSGWRVLTQGGSVRCAVVEGRAALPGQRGALYELAAEGDVNMKAQRTTWLSRSLVRAAGRFESWPDEPAVKSACGCAAKASCACGPCRARHDHDHSHEGTS